MEIRLATEADNQALIDLTRETPMRGAVTVYVDRAPDFFTISKLQGDENFIWLAEEDGELLGCLSGVTRQVLYRGKKVNQLYACDLKVHPKARGRQLGKKLTAKLFEHARQDPDIEMVEVEIITGNDAMIYLREWVKGDRIAKVVPSGNAYIFQVMPYKRQKVPGDYNIRVATPEDLPEIADLLYQTYRGYNAAPLFNEGELEKALQGHPSFTVDCFRVAEKDGRLVAAAAFWDQMSLRQTIVQKVSTGTAAFLSFLRAVRLVWKIPEIPRIGNPLVPIFLRFPACAEGHPDALKAIVHTECNALKAQGKYHFLWASFHQSDPLIACVEETWKLKMSVDVYHLQIRESMNILEEEQAIAHPIYVDFSIV